MNPDFGEIGFKPTTRSNPLSKLMPGGGGGNKEKKGSSTPAAPPSTPATYTSEDGESLINISIQSVLSIPDTLGPNNTKSP